MHSNPVIAFFQALMPWASIDRSGRTTALTFEGIWRDKIVPGTEKVVGLCQVILGKIGEKGKSFMGDKLKAE